MLTDLKSRVREPEIMDRPDLDPSEHRRALDGLARLNVAAMSSRAFLGPLLNWSRRLNRTLRILDVASGAGDSLIALKRAATRHGLALEAFGCDRSPTAIEHASERARRAGVEVGFQVADVLLDQDAPVEADIVLNSLFVHHLSEQETIGFLRRMTRWAKHGVIIVDLLRTRFDYALAFASSRLLTRSPVVHFDALASVRAAYTLSEIRDLTQRAAIANARIERIWPERFRWSVAR